MLALSFDPIALERCFLVADVLAEEFGQSFLEYALIGLSTSNRPLHVVQTHLLPGQRVTAASVHQPGSAVLRLRRQIQALSQRARRKLLPVTIAHRHPGRSCTPSAIDRTFLRGVWSDQLSTVLTVPEMQFCAPTRPPCGCEELRQERPRERRAADIPGIAFSLVVSRERDYELHAAAKHRCPFCGRSWVCDVPTKLVLDPERRLSPEQLHALRRALRREIEETFDPRDLEVKRNEHGS